MSSAVGVGAVGRMAVVVTMVVAVIQAVVVVSLGMIHFLKRRSGQTDGPIGGWTNGQTDRRTDALKEMRGRI